MSDLVLSPEHKAETRSLKKFVGVRRLISSVGGHLTSRGLSSVVPSIVHALSKTKSAPVAVQALIQTYQPYVDRQATPAVLTEMALLACGRFSEILDGHVVLPSAVPTQEMPAAMLIRQSSVFYKDKKEHVKLVGLVYSGPATGKTQVLSVTSGFADYLGFAIGLRRSLSLDGRATYLANMAFYGLFDSSDPSAIKVKQITVTSAQAKHNREVMSRRVRFDVDLDNMSESRADKFECPNMFTVECATCVHFQCSSSFRVADSALEFP